MGPSPERLRAGPTRYRVMVLTSWNRRMRYCEWIIACDTNDTFVPTILDSDENVIRTLAKPA
jgi:hypothetical protein